MLEILYYIFIFPVEQVLEWALFTLFKATKNYGVSIILLSLIMQLFMLKLTFYFDKKATSFGALKAQCDSKIKEFKRVFKGAELQSYIRTLYKQRHFHPIFALFGLGGLALQIPFFIAMIHLVENAEYLQSVRFLWIDDLSKPDSIMLFGLSIHILPLLMTAFTLINVFYSSKELGARIQGSLIALLFLVLLYSMPSALVLYWTCNMAFALFKEIFKQCRNKRHSVLSDKSGSASPYSLRRMSNTPHSQDLHNPNFSSQSLECRDSNTRIADSLSCHTEQSEVSKKRDSNNTNSSKSTKIPSKATQPQGKLKTILFNIFTPHAALDFKTYTTYRNISILAILNICFIICVFSPYALYSSDVSQFDVKQTYQTLAVLFGAFLCSSFMVIYITSFFYKTRLFKFGVYVVSTLFLIGVINTFIFVGDYGAMDHFVLQKPEFNNPNNLLYALCAFIASVAIVYFCFKWLKSIFSVSFITLCVLSVISFFNIMEANKTYIVPKSLVAEDNNLQPYEKELFSYSKTEKNIIVMVLDAFSGSHIHPLLEQFPEFKTNLDGFVLFDNAISTTNNTIHSIATLIGGEYYSTYNMNARKDILVDSITEAFGVIGDTFVKNGYDVGYFMSETTRQSQINEIRSYNENIFVTDNVFIYTDYFLSQHPENAMELHQQNSSNTAVYKQLLSYGTFRFSPETLRSKIYNNGKWFRYKGLGYRIIDPNVRGSLGYTSSMYAFTHLHNTESKKPTFKYLHTCITHPPYAMYYNGKKCLFQGPKNQLANKTAWHDHPHKETMSYSYQGERDFFFKHYDSEACALNYLDYLIQWLKDNAIYNNTQILIVSDHGSPDSMGIPRFIIEKNGRPETIFLFKDFNASGELKVDSRLMANYDISSIFCENLPNGCPNVPKNILKNYPNNRKIITATPITSDLKKHKKNEWIIDHYFQVKGNIYDENSWQDITKEVKDGTFKIDGIRH
ncbi:MULTISPECIES: YidC/Oxa1 family membrane protein insertase [Helicobacter]|uniref:YidC/Oxa1 family membrane protein insertase n=1 Tax=Helicobacter bilis ATCC 43879 TaxID=613026 RepID=T5LDL6_9HELI|nr:MULTISPECIES: YidC/Oxa1 family membrane protein insertase [Helicobacter]EQM94658.1 YidC/Oxa1 family membrane protein insertase [Helicobacter bilis ATCC 43879]